MDLHTLDPCYNTVFLHHCPTRAIMKSVLYWNTFRQLLHSLYCSTNTTMATWTEKVSKVNTKCYWRTDSVRASDSWSGCIATWYSRHHLLTTGMNYQWWNGAVVRLLSSLQHGRDAARFSWSSLLGMSAPARQTVINDCDCVQVLEIKSVQQ